MITKDEGYTLTDVPGMDFIKIEPREDGGAVVILKDDVGSPPRAWQIDKAEGFMLALERAVDMAKSVRTQNEQANR